MTARAASARAGSRQGKSESAAAFELEVLQGETGIDRELGERLIGLANALRALKDHDLEEAASTRLLVYAATLIKDGFDLRDACRAALVEPLSEREVEVLRLMAGGYKYQEIADRMIISINTVRHHNRNIFSKLNVNSRQQAVEKAETLGIHSRR